MSAQLFLTAFFIAFSIAFFTDGSLLPSVIYPTSGLCSPYFCVPFYYLTAEASVTPPATDHRDTL